jgi:hypothetical protein
MNDKSIGPFLEDCEQIARDNASMSSDEIDAYFIKEGQDHLATPERRQAFFARALGDPGLTAKPKLVFDRDKTIPKSKD